MVRDANRALLTVTGGKLVPDLRDTCSAHPNFDELLPLGIGSDQHLIDETTFCAPERCRHVPSRVSASAVPTPHCLEGSVRSFQ